MEALIPAKRKPSGGAGNALRDYWKQVKIEKKSQSNLLDSVNTTQSKAKSRWQFIREKKSQIVQQSTERTTFDF